MNNILSVIIVNYNTCDLLRDCLTSVILKESPFEKEVWVVDNVSTDGSLDMVRAEFPSVKIIANTDNVGFARANNQALAIAQGDWCLLLNSDAFLQDGALQELEYMISSKSNIGAIGTLLRNKDGSLQPSWGNFASPWTEFLFQSFLFKLVPVRYPLGKRIHPLMEADYKRNHTVDWVSAACMAVSRNAIEKAGFMDEGNFMYGEDMEWCWRLRKAGFDVLFCPSARVVHLNRSSSQRNFARWIENYTQGTLSFIGKTRSRLSLCLAGWFILMGSVLRIVLWGVLGWMLPMRRDESQQRIIGYQRAIHLTWKSIWHGTNFK